MNSSRPRKLRVRLDPEAYRDLHREVLQRDGWRCQVCGSMQQLQVHHLNFRAHSGSDSEENLITLCAACHKQMHCMMKGTKAQSRDP